jgi:CRP-like cAMP-binding protein
MSLLDPNPFRSFFDKLASRSTLGDAERQAILSLPGHPVQVQCNRDFVRLGERVDHASLVVDGLIGRFGQNKEGQRQITAVHISGDMADLHSVVAPDAGSALQALSVTTVMKVPHAALREAARRYPAIAEALWRECVVDAAVLAEWIVNVGRRPARARAAHLLCEMACRYEREGQNVGFSFGFPATQTHLADILALTPVHVNRMLKLLRQQELAHVYNRTVHILDWSGIVEAGEFDPSYLRIGQLATDTLLANRVGTPG